MKVRCTKLLDALGRPASQSPWLTIGKMYQVLSVVLDAQRQWSFRLIGDIEPGLGLFPLDQFEIVSPRIPSSWIAIWNADGVFELTPEAWTTEFWTLFFENDPTARHVFKSEVLRMIEEEP